MKDYTFVLDKNEREEQQKEFILYYKYDSKRIVVYTADGDKKTYKYSNEKIEDLNIQMKRQFKTLGEEASDILFQMNIKFLLSSLAASFLYQINRTESSSANSKFISALFPFMFPIINLIMRKNMIQDLEKHSLLFENEELVQAFNCITTARYFEGLEKTPIGESCVSVDTDDLTKGVNRKRVNDLYDYSKEHIHLDLNTVNVLKAKDVKRLLKNSNQILLNMYKDEKTMK